MLSIDIMSRTPVYEQIIIQLERLIGAGILKEGEQLPSVRALSLKLSVNPNTIQKAYGELDSRGIVGSVPGKGCFVMPGAVAVLQSNAKKRLCELGELCCELMTCGVTKEEILDAVNTAINSKEETK